MGRLPFWHSENSSLASARGGGPCGVACRQAGFLRTAVRPVNPPTEVLRRSNPNGVVFWRDTGSYIERSTVRAMLRTRPIATPRARHHATLSRNSI